MRSFSDSLRLQGKIIGFVPTMGYLHEGHLSLVRKSRQECDVTIASIFVNPTQFSPNEDLDKYPRNFERDEKLLTDEGTAAVFYPDVSEIYPDGYQTYVEVTGLTRLLEGEKRPTHFKGVTTVVSILFNIVKPHKAFFGQKDAQQAAVIERMTNDLQFGIDIVVCPIIREADGLAMSSRNVYLSEKERRDATVLYKSLQEAERMIAQGEKDADSISAKMKAIISKADTSNLEYISIVEKESFLPAGYLESNNSYLILIACNIGATRLIDNAIITL